MEIGVSEGDWPYMLSDPAAFWVASREIFVLDAEQGQVLVYDRAGKYLRALGRRGPGPFEFESPIGLLVRADGDVLVTSTMGAAEAKVAAFHADGTPRAEWTVQARADRLWLNPQVVLETPSGLVVGATKLPEQMSRQGIERRIGFQAFDGENPAGPPWLPPENPRTPPTLIRRGSAGMTLIRPVPFAVTRPATAMSTSGDVVWGYPNDYSFSVEHAAGGATHVRCTADPAPVLREEAEYHRRNLETSFRRGEPKFSWDGGTMPSVKPWYDSFHLDTANRLWVTRELPAARVPDCASADDPSQSEVRTPCWIPRYEFDVFELDGTYLGRVPWPEGLDHNRALHFGDQTIAGYHETASGTPTVRVYRVKFEDAGADSVRVHR